MHVFEEYLSFMHQNKKSLFCMDKSKSHKYPSNHQFSRYAMFLTAYQYLNMHSGREVEARALEFQKIVEVFEDIYGGIFYTILSFDPIHKLKTKMDAFKDQGTGLHNVFQPHLYFFYPDQTLNFLDFINWCSSNYSLSERIIMDSSEMMIVCPVNALASRESIVIPPIFTQNQENFSE